MGAAAAMAAMTRITDAEPEREFVQSQLCEICGGPRHEMTIEKRTKNTVHTITINTDELSYLLELINNERYTNNINAVLADRLTEILSGKPKDAKQRKCGTL